MRLLYITNGINGSGGLERVLSVKASHLADQLGYDITILSLNEQGGSPFYKFSSKINFCSITVGRNPFQYLKSYIEGIKKAIKSINPDVISVCDDGLKGFFLPIILASKVPMIYERHASIALNTNSSLKGKVMRYLMQKQVAKFNRFVVLTDSNKSEWEGNNIVAISNPLSFYPTENAQLINKKIIVVGTHNYNKGYDLLVQAWQNVNKLHPDWELHVYGKKDAGNTYLNLTKDLNLEKSIFFHDPVSNIQEKYLESSIMLLPSRTEGFGMVLIEAMACGVPCVSFDCPSGPRDIITNNEDGFLVANANIELFSHTICRLISNKDLRIRMGAKAKENVKRYMPENISEQWDNLFNEITS